MNQEIKVRIREYLCGPRDYAEGVELYRQYGANLRLKREFAAGESQMTRSMLEEQLCHIAGISQRELARLPRLSKRVPAVKGVERPEGESPVVSAPEPATAAVGENAPASETAVKMIRFREKYPFLNSPDCPDVLKILVADMFTAYGCYKEAYARLQQLGDADAEEAAEQARKVVDNYLENREIWEELDYYREHGEILGKSSYFRNAGQEEDLSQLSDVDLMKRINSATANVSKRKKEVAETEAAGGDVEKARAAYVTWTARKEALAAELERRKKK